MSLALIVTIMVLVNVYSFLNLFLLLQVIETIINVLYLSSKSILWYLICDNTLDLLGITPL